MDEAQLQRVLDHVENTKNKDSEVLLAIKDVKTDTALLTLTMEQVKKDVQEHEEFIKGPPYPGAEKEIDRLSQSSKFQKKGLWLVITTTMGVAAKAVHDFFTATP